MRPPKEPIPYPVELEPVTCPPDELPYPVEPVVCLPGLPYPVELDPVMCPPDELPYLVELDPIVCPPDELPCPYPDGRLGLDPDLDEEEYEPRDDEPRDEPPDLPAFTSSENRIDLCLINLRNIFFSSTLIVNLR